MKNFFSLSFFLIPFFLISQESLQPLRTNMSLFDIPSSKRTQSIENFDFIYLTDTLSLPLIDDFSTNKFKVYKTDTSGPNISDSSWNYLFFLDGSLVPLTNSYMSSPTFTYAYDSINSNGLDTLIMLTIQNDPDTLIINNLFYYPITSDTIILWPNVTIIDSLWTAASPDTTFANLSSDYSQDSISLYFVSPEIEDLNKIWLDNDVFLNYNYPINPWTLGVVTFDGLNSSGNPYDWTTGATDWSDQLTSKPIFLGNKDISDSLYFSFYFQAGGYGETPDSDDSLILEFYNPSNNEWNSVWSTNGFDSDQWYYEHILLDSSKYFQDGFRFRFNSYGSLNGSLDHWNLDYVYFNESRSMNDTLMQDWAFTSPPLSMLENYSSVPWKHFKNTTSEILLKNAIIPSYNSSDNPKLLQPCSMDLFYDDILQSSFPYSATVLNVPELSYFDMFYDFGSSFELNTLLTDTFVDYSQKTMLHWLEQSGQLIWASERSGWNHLYRIDATSGEVINPITKGKWLVRKIEHVDEKNEVIWFSAMGIHPNQDPYHLHLAKVNLDGSGLTILTRGDGTHRWEFNPARTLFVDRWSRVDHPEVAELRSARDGSLIKEIARQDISALIKEGYSMPIRSI